MGAISGREFPVESGQSCRCLLALRNEIPRVRFELHVFQLEYLPALFSSRRSVLVDWQYAARQLVQGLPARNGTVPPAAPLFAFRAFHGYASLKHRALLQPSDESCLTIEDWPPIRWHICPCHPGPFTDKNASEVAPGIGSCLAISAMSLANNHFLEVGRIFEEPEVREELSSWMPRLLGAVLFHKVVGLRELALEQRCADWLDGGDSCMRKWFVVPGVH
jgi:hypothetical protein